MSAWGRSLVSRMLPILFHPRSEEMELVFLKHRQMEQKLYMSLAVPPEMLGPPKVPPVKESNPALWNKLMWGLRQRKRIDYWLKMLDRKVSDGRTEEPMLRGEHPASEREM